MDDIYEPREDSFLLEKHVSKLAKGNVLDIGTGSGIQAKAAMSSEKVKSVTAVDINPKAILKCKKDKSLKDISFMKSDLFSNVKGKFDTIIFNPPYLPNEKNTPDLALDGGPKGYELTIRFIKEAGEHLTDDGQILLLFSSLTKKEVIDAVLSDNLYDFKLLKEQKIDFEKLYVYRIFRSEVYSALIKSGITDISPFARGKRGIIFKAKYKKKIVAIKTKRSTSEALNRIDIEKDILLEVNKKGIGPKLLASGRGFIIMELIEGPFFLDYISDNDIDEVRDAIIAVLEQCRILDKMDLVKEEMHNPVKHIIMSGKKPMMIDFERARHTYKTKNLTQFCQFLSGPQVKVRLDSLGIVIDRKKLTGLAREYSLDKKNFTKITDYINKASEW